MKKSFVFVLTFLCIVVFAAPAFAAPGDIFSDVPANDWAYGAIKQLAKAGIVEGYSDGTYRGQNTLNRYEMAIIVANAMTKFDKADDQQKALIEKLATEFDAELASLGKRLSKVEASRPNLQIGGQARLTYASRSDAANNSFWGYDSTRNNYVTYRLRLEVSGQPDPNLSFFARLTGDDYDVETGGQNPGSGASTSPGTQVKTMNSPTIEQFWVKWKMGDTFSVTGGRQALLLGKGDFAYTTGGDDILSLDYVKPNFSFKAAYWNVPGEDADNGVVPSPYMSAKNDALLTQLTYAPSTNSHIDIFNIHELENDLTAYDDLYNGYTSMYHENLTSIGLDTKISDKLAFFGEYGKNTGYSDHNTGYWYGITNGNPSYHPGLGLLVPASQWTKVGANAQALIYRYYGGNVNSVFNAQFNSVLGNDTLAGALWLADTKGPEFYSQNVVAKNVFFLTQIGEALNIDTSQRESTYGQIALYMVF